MFGFLTRRLSEGSRRASVVVSDFELEIFDAVRYMHFVAGRTGN